MITVNMIIPTAIVIVKIVTVNNKNTDTPLFDKHYYLKSKSRYSTNRLIFSKITQNIETLPQLRV